MTGVLLTLTLFFAVPNMDLAYAAATSCARYVIGAIEYLLPPAVYVAVRVFDKRSRPFDSAAEEGKKLKEEGQCKEGKA